MGRWSWLATFGDPVLMGAMAASIVVPLLIFSPPVSSAISVALVAGLAWINHRLESSVSKLPVQNGPEAMIGCAADVVQSLNPAGLVRCGGEMWRAEEIRGRRVAEGQRVRVVGVRSLELQVERL